MPGLCTCPGSPLSPSARPYLTHAKHYFFPYAHNSAIMAANDKILAALESLKLADSINYTATAKMFSVNRSTLSKRYRGV